MHNRGCIVSERARDTERGITSRVHACETRDHSALFAFAAYAYGCSFARWNFLLHAAKENNSAEKFFVFEAK